MKIGLLSLAIAAAMHAGPALAAELTGPARFCGYAPIIDLLPGERITTLQGGMHAGTFIWGGAFGRLEVTGIGWGSRPNGKVLPRPTSTGMARFAEQRVKDRYTVAIWNRRQGAAYFSSPRPLTKAQFRAIDRVNLFQEGEEPTGCKLRTIFSWEF